MGSHPNQMALERFWSSDLPSESRQRVESHIEDCSDCSKVLSELSSFAAAELTTNPPAAFMARVSARSKKHHRAKWYWGTMIPTLVLSACILIFMTSRGTSEDSSPRILSTDKITWKGAGLTIHRQRDGVAEIAADNKIRANDALRLVVTLQKESALAVWFIDKNRRLDSFVEPSSRTFASGRHELPESARIEAPCVDTWIVVGIGDGASKQTEATLKKRIAQSVPDGDAWLPPNTTSQFLRCE